MSTGLYLISPPEGSFLEELKSIVEYEVEYFQYRRPGRSDRERFEELNRVVSILEGTATKLIVNDRPDLAKSVEASGVHLGADDLPVDDVKEAWPELVVGQTVRRGQSPAEGADYLGVGPVFSPFSKAVDHDPFGWDGVREVIDSTEKDVYAIGGIEPDRLKEIPEGLSGVCVIGAVWDRPDPVEGLKALRQVLDGLS